MGAKENLDVGNRNRFLPRRFFCRAGLPLFLSFSLVISLSLFSLLRARAPVAVSWLSLSLSFLSLPFSSLSQTAFSRVLESLSPTFLLLLPLSRAHA